MTSRIYQMYKNLEQCTQSFEQDVKNSLEQLNKTNQNQLELEGIKDYHYREILNQLKEIRERIKIIADHDHNIRTIQNKLDRSSSQTKIDKDYIKKQVETFQKLGLVQKRQHKPIRPPEAFSNKILDCWEKILEEDGVKEQPSQALPFVIKREESLRKKKTIVSSTFETLLDNSLSVFHTFEDSQAIERSKSVDALNERVVSEYSVDTKPRIVDVIYKKGVTIPT